ncbi:MAG: hypothetical protein Q8N17_14205 [Burkholderiaceae bacterium]|nr:hypothetical protein [Burkholderiaceae bacterium]
MRDRRDFHLEGLSGDSIFSPWVGTGVAQMRKDTEGSGFMLEKVSRRQPGLPSGEERKENAENEPEDSMAPLQDSMSHRPLSLSALQNLPMIPLPTIVWSGGTLPVTDVIQSSPEFQAISIPVTQPKKKTPDR